MSMLQDKLALFPTHVYRFANPTAAADHEAWRKAIHRLRATDPGRALSNQLGWQSSAPFHNVPELAGLGRFIFQCLEEFGRIEGWQLERYGFILDAWININGKGASNTVHNHPNCLLSGSYYLDTPPGGGDIVLRDPREVAYVYQPPYADGRSRSPDQAITPFPGLLLLFPPWLLHWVEPNRGEAERISVAFNVGIGVRGG